MAIFSPILRPILRPLTRAITEAGGGGSFSPLTLFAAGEQGAWYDPSDLSTMFSDSAGTTPAVVDGVVGKMLDKSGRGNHAVQATTAQKPILRSSGGLYWLEFDGVDDTIEYTTATALTAQSVVQAIRPDNATSFLYSFGGALNAGGLALSSNGSTKYTVGYGTGAAVSTLATGATIVANTAVVVGGSYDGTTVRGFTNGNAPASAVASVPAGPTSYKVGSYNNGSAGRPGRYYGHIHIGRYWAEAERLAVVRYLATKSGVTL